MERVGQIGIAIGTLGTILLMMGLFPGMTGLDPTPGIGVIQLMVILVGFTLFITGALLYVKYTFYAYNTANLVQLIGTRLAMTGVLLAGLFSLADAFGFGSHGQEFSIQNFLGPLQIVGIVTSYAIACIGVLVYALGGQSLHDDPQDEPDMSENEQLMQDDFAQTANNG
ncbi:MAG: hypothetical protein MUE54_08950 [Anaerolineae bacterium]|jgi:hypothetical protein|nr:hypothetical protein [Anaerolineae bacterium]